MPSNFGQTNKGNAIRVNTLL